VAEGNLERAKEKAPQPDPLTPAADAIFTGGKEQGQILSRLDALENHSATKADLHSTHLAISAATIAALLVFLSVSVGANIALFRMLVGTILDAFTSAIHQPLRPPSSSLPRDAIGPRDDLVSPEP
jgi:hypothetical protein